MDLQYPSMRSELLAHLEELADRELQQRTWNRGPHLDEAVHFLFDDTTLHSDPASNVGVFLLDRQEALLVGLVTKKLDAIFNLHGLHLTDAEYVALPEWSDVVNAAANALARMKAGTVC